MIKYFMCIKRISFLFTCTGVGASAHVPLVRSTVGVFIYLYVVTK